MLTEGHRGGRIEGRGINVPRFARRNRLAHNKPDVPQVETVVIRGLDRFVPEGSRDFVPSGLVDKKASKRTTKFGQNGTSAERTTKGTIYSQVARRPLTPELTIHFGGGRVGGGGTSEKSLRRAKKKQRMRRKR